MTEARSVGVTVMPEYAQSEGVDAVLDNLQSRANVTGIATSPYVMEPTDAATGGREPPIDAGAGGVRLLDRPLWGHRELFVRTAPSFVPDTSFYSGLHYQPTAPTALTDSDGAVVGRFIDAAKARGLQVHLQIQAAIPPGYRVQFGGPAPADQPRLPTGETVANRVDKNASLASPEVVGYGQALIRDMVRAYPNIDGIRVDWAEYPPYAFESLFFDFSDHAARAAAQWGFDFDRMRHDTSALIAYLQGHLSDDDLILFAGPDGVYALLSWLRRHPGVWDMQRLKTRIVGELLRAYRAALTEAGGADMELVTQAFPPPWNLVSGFDYAGAATVVDAIGVKLYTMHWPMIVRFYGDALLRANPGVTEVRLLQALTAILDLTDGPSTRNALSDWGYPEPDTPHPVGAQAQVRKIAAARRETGGAPVIAFTHAYGPATDFRDRVAAVFAAAGRRTVINRYGYLSDEKLDLLGEVTA